MKSFDDIINDKVNEGLVDKWLRNVNPNIGEMLKDIMRKLDEIDAKVTKYEGESSGEN